jgi:hypothetical protein
VNRLLFGIITATSLIVLVVALLGFADAWSIKPDTRCFEALATSQFPKWIGCTMAAHEGLAGGLIGAAGALFAAWLAFSTIQEQFAHERERREHGYEEAKQVAIVVLALPIHAGSCALSAINQALAAERMDPVQRTAAGVDIGQREQAVQLAITYLEGALNNFNIREVVRDLGVKDRMLYVAICSTLGTVVDLTKWPGQQVPRREHLVNRQNALMNVRAYLRGFSTELADEYERDRGHRHEAVVSRASLS